MPPVSAECGCQNHFKFIAVWTRNICSQKASLAIGETNYQTESTDTGTQVYGWLSPNSPLDPFSP